MGIAEPIRPMTDQIDMTRPGIPPKVSAGAELRTMMLAWSRRRIPCMMAVALALLGGCGERKQAAAPPPPKPAVGVRAATMKGVAQSFSFVGRIKAVDKVDLRARVEGFLDKVQFREGQTVKTGDLLYQIEKVQFQALVDQAKANVASAEAEVTNAQLQYNRSLELSRREFSPQAVVDQN